jgi:Na+/H+-dicarboxylate symporter
MRHVEILGDLFLLALRMIVVPLVVASLVGGAATLGALRGVGRAARVTVVYFFATMGIAVLVGIAFVTTLRPGEGAALAPTGEISASVLDRTAEGPWEAVKDLLRSFLSPNVIGAMASDPPGMLAVIVFALAFGVVLGRLGPRGRPLLDVFEVLDDVLSRLVRLVVATAPVGVFALIAARLARAGGGEAAWAQIRGLGLYVVTVIAGLAVHGFVVLPTALRLLGGRRPGPFARGMTPALLTAFSTASSTATLPVTIDCVARRNGVSARAVRFVAPLGATLNMNGTALYEAVAAVFIAQAYGVHLGPVDLVLVAVTATFAAIGASAVPEAGLVTMVIVLQTVGLPIEGIGLILAVDWFLDRCRTTVNVWDDGVGAAVVERLARLGATEEEPPGAPAGAGSS